MGDFGDLEYFYRGFEHGVMTERHRILDILKDITIDPKTLRELIRRIEERATYE